MLYKFLRYCLKRLNPLKFLKNFKNWLRFDKKSPKMYFSLYLAFLMCFLTRSIKIFFKKLQRIFLDYYEENDEKKTKILVITDIIENNISLRVICGKSDWKMGHANKEKMVKNVFLSNYEGSIIRPIPFSFFANTNSFKNLFTITIYLDRWLESVNLAITSAIT